MVKYIKVRVPVYIRKDEVLCELEGKYGSDMLKDAIATLLCDTSDSFKELSEIEVDELREILDKGD